MIAIDVVGACLRGVLDSRGQVTIEADVTLGDGSRGRGSAPQAIAPGRRERPRSAGLRIGPCAGSAAVEQLQRWLMGVRCACEEDLDAALTRQVVTLGVGADATLAVSQAVWRAAAAAAGEALQSRMAAHLGATPGMPHPLVNIFSGGIHDSREQPDGYQAIVAIPELGSAIDDVEAAVAIWDAVQERMLCEGRRVDLAASSGMKVAGLTGESLLCELHDQIRRHSDAEAPMVGIGVDVAAEHLATGDGRYRLDGRCLPGEEMLTQMLWLAERFDLRYLEDPFAPEDEELWRELNQRLPAGTCLVGDDLFATDPMRVDPSLAGGILLKPIQAGTVSVTLDAARRALDAGMVPCVSHRSGETEDTFACELAVAVGARFQKIGGPRRGDRVAKYNQLLRIDEELSVPQLRHRA